MATTEWTGADPYRTSGDRGADLGGRYAGTAGLPRRAVALGIDYALLLAICAGIDWATEAAGLERAMHRTTASLLQFAVIALYFALLEGSSGQATLGKWLLDLRVTDDQGGRITVSRALGRFFAKLLSLAPFGIGLLMAAFTERHRALHDVLAGTLVQRVRPGPPPQ